MKKSIILVIVAAALNSIVSCAQNRQLVEKTPFQITENYFSSWIAEQPQNSSGMNVFIKIADKPENITLKTLFFKGQSAPITATKDNIYSAQFTANQQKKDYNISIDKSKEVNNPKPQLPVKSPVQIASDEALLVYSDNGTEHYYKLKNLQDKGTKYPAEAPFNKND